MFSCRSASAQIGKLTSMAPDQLKVLADVAQDSNVYGRASTWKDYHFADVGIVLGMHNCSIFLLRCFFCYLGITQVKNIKIQLNLIILQPPKILPKTSTGPLKAPHARLKIM